MPTQWVTPRTWTPYEPVTRDLLNTYVRNQFLSVQFLSTRYVTTDTSVASLTLNLPTSSEAKNCELRIFARGEGAGNSIACQTGLSSGTQHFWQINRYAGPTGSTAIEGVNSTSWIIGNLPGSGGSTADMAFTKLVLPNYNSTYNIKSFLSQTVTFLSSASTSGFISNITGYFYSTAALTTLVLFTTAGNFSAGCEFSVYGLP